MMMYFRILEPNSLNIVNKDMNDKGNTESNLPFWYNINDNEFILKVSSHSCKCDVVFEKDIEYNIDVEFRNYRTKTNNGCTCILKKITNTSNNNTSELE